MPVVGTLPDIRTAGLLDHFRDYLIGRRVAGERSPVEIPASALADQATFERRIVDHHREMVPEFLSFFIEHHLSDDDRNELHGRFAHYLETMRLNSEDDLDATVHAADAFERQRRRHRPRGPSSNNYVRYLVGANETAMNQSIDIDDETITYGVNLHVRSSSSIYLDLVVDGEEIHLHAGTPDRLVAKVMRCSQIEHGHVRSRIAFVVLKQFVTHMQRQGVDLIGMTERPLGALPSTPGAATNSQGIARGSEFFLRNRGDDLVFGYHAIRP